MTKIRERLEQLRTLRVPERVYLRNHPLQANPLFHLATFEDGAEYVVTCDPSSQDDVRLYNLFKRENLFNRESNLIESNHIVLPDERENYSSLSEVLERETGLTGLALTEKCYLTQVGTPKNLEIHLLHSPDLPISYFFLPSRDFVKKIKSENK